MELGTDYVTNLSKEIKAKRLLRQLKEMGYEAQVI